MISPFLASLIVLSIPVLVQSGEPHFTARIKNVVVLVEENRSHDTFFGGLTYNPKIEGLLHTTLCNPVNLTDPTQGTLCSAPTLGDLDPDDPNHGISGVNNQLFGTFHPSLEAQSDITAETMIGFLAEQEGAFRTTNISRAAEALNFYDENNIPVIKALAENFTVFQQWFAAVPGPTNPNRCYLTAGTSAGHGRNDHDFDTSSIPVRSIFQQVDEANITWINYFNSSFNPDSKFFSWTISSGRATTNVKPISQFFIDAAAGTLPQFTYINPECCSFNSFHPPGRTTDGESFVKTIYEALRSSPQWNEMLFIMTFDEHGGFADHIPPPVNVPAGDNLTYTERSPDGKNMTFDFTRLGVRVPTFLISPWVEKGLVVPAPDPGEGAFTHTSILSTLAKVWDLDVLTPRVAFSPTFDHVILEEMRTDTPVTLPDPIPF